MRISDTNIQDLTEKLEISKKSNREMDLEIKSLKRIQESQGRALTQMNFNPNK